MPKLVTVVGALVVALLAGPTLAQEEPSAPEATEPVETAPADAAEEGAETAPVPAAEDNTADEAAGAATQPAGPSTQPAASGAATQPAASGPATQPAASGAATQPATDALAPTDAPPAAAAPDRAAAPGIALASDEPTIQERRLVAYVSTGVAAVALGTGITLGVIALNQYNCLSDVTVCNEGLEEPIVGQAFLDKKADVDTLTLLADMAYVVAAAATIVAVTGYIRGYFLTDEEPAAEVTP